MLEFWCFSPDCFFSGNSPAFHFLPQHLLTPRRNFPPTSLSHLLFKMLRSSSEGGNVICCHGIRTISSVIFARTTWIPFSILPSWVLDLVAPCNPVMEPHLKARRIPRRTISLKQSHYHCLSMCDWPSNATGRSSASARGHQGEVLPGTLTSGVPFPACRTTISLLLFSYLCLAPSCQFVVIRADVLYGLW